MASSSGASSNTGYPKTSRFSTLKMFKLNGKDKPPPPPPKDPYYLPNRSMTSLSPDSLSIPPQSPLSPHYFSQYPHRQSPVPSQSTMSLVSSAASQLSVTPADQVAPKKKKSINFLKFGKRSKSFTKEAEVDVRPPPLPREGGEKEGDPGITWPSNFQHNIHVDDGLSGLPPSWAKSLAERGYTEEEIANMNARRAANLRLQQLYSGRPESPASSITPFASQSQSPPNDRSASPSSNEHNSSPVLTNPVPRSTSLTRKFSNASMHGRSPHPPPTNVPVPSLITSPSSTSLHSIRTTNSSNSSKHPTPARYNAASSYHNPSISTMSSDGHLSYQTIPNVPPALPAVPSTPTRRMQVANPNTPPPAYSAFRNTIIAHQDVNVESTTSSQGERSGESSSTQSTPQLQRQRNEGLSRPPRLSLHASNDSDDWSKLVLSAGSLIDTESEDSSSSSVKLTLPIKTTAPTCPIPPITVPDSEEDGVAANSAQPLPTGWAEPSSTARYPPPSSSSSPPASNTPSRQDSKSELGDLVKKEDFKEIPLSAALTESFLPTISDSLSRSRQRDTLRPGPDGTLLMPPQDKYMQREGEDDQEEDDDFLSVRRSNRDSSRSSTSTLSTSTVTAYTYSTPQIIRNASVVRRAGAYVTKLPASPNKEVPSQQQQDSGSSSGSRRHSGAPPSPMNSQFGSDESAGSASTASSSSQSQGHPTPTTDPGSAPGLGTVELDLASYYTTTPSPAHEEEDEEGTWDTLRGNMVAAALNDSSGTWPLIVVSDEPPSPESRTEPTWSPPSAGTSSLPLTPLTPVQRYPGWLSGVVKPLAQFIDEAVEPREHYFELQEIAEGESGSIFAARINPANADKLRLHPKVKMRDTTELKKGAPALVAVKIVAITPPSSTAQLPETQKLIDLERELKLMKGLWHENVLGLDALYVDLTEDTLWVRMELMERSLADIIGLVVDGLVLHDRMIARFAQDVLYALQYLQEHRIAHRDVRSDNLLLDSHGVLKLTDFSNAVKLPPESSLRSDPAGVIFWQAPEMRYPNYDALKVDVWSLGATVWEMAETEPPFSDTKQVQSRWPPLTRPELWSPTFHSFLRACSDSAGTRKSPKELLKDPFVSNVCGRGVIVQLLSQCMSIERMIQPAND
ncbi:Serine/threonine-protein kinase pakA [Leucoagaricus sp. SymC.cos]|nr:Serine/threonine-protein kinase pakA [Leucoagaricus sp. SymC.cos]